MNKINLKELNLHQFNNYGARVSRKISITKSSSFGIPPHFYKENELNKYSYVQLFYDKSQKVVGLHFKSVKEEEGAFKLINYGEGDKKGASFVARSFFKQYDIDTKLVYGRYEPEEYNKESIGKIFLIKLEERGNQDKEQFSS